MTLIYIEINKELSHFNQDSLHCQLNYIVRDIFKKKVLVFVDEIKGYKPILNIDKIICNRITSGTPRCKYYNWLFISDIIFARTNENFGGTAFPICLYIDDTDP